MASYSHVLPNNVLVDERFKDYIMIRKFSVTELEKLQGFPIDWVNSVDISYTNKVKCLGNAVNGEVAYFIFYCLRNFN